MEDQTQEQLLTTTTATEVSSSEHEVMEHWNDTREAEFVDHNNNKYVKKNESDGNPHDDDDSGTTTTNNNNTNHNNDPMLQSTMDGTDNINDRTTRISVDAIAVAPPPSSSSSSSSFAAELLLSHDSLSILETNKNTNDNTKNTTTDTHSRKTSQRQRRTTSSGSCTNTSTSNRNQHLRSQTLQRRKNEPQQISVLASVTATTTTNNNNTSTSRSSRSVIPRMTSENAAAVTTGSTTLNQSKNNSHSHKRIPNPKRTKKNNSVAPNNKEYQLSRSIRSTAVTTTGSTLPSSSDGDESPHHHHQRHITTTTACDDDYDDDANVKAVSNPMKRSGKDNTATGTTDRMYRITNPLILDYNEEYTNQPTPTQQQSLSLVRLQQITNGISFAIPDTYSLRYMMQLLGLSQQSKMRFHELNAIIHNSNSNGRVSIEQLQQVLSSDHSNRIRHNDITTTTTTIPTNDDYHDQYQDDTIYHIPAIVVPYISNPYRNNYWTTNTSEEIDLLLSSSSSFESLMLQQPKKSNQPQHLLSSSSSSSSSLLLDPFYIQLWQSLSSSSSSFVVGRSSGNHQHHRIQLQRIPITFIQHAKIFNCSNNNNVSSSISGGVSTSITLDPIVTTATTTSPNNKITSNDSNSNAVAEELPLSDPDPSNVQQILDHSSTRSISPSTVEQQQQLLLTSSISSPNNTAVKERFMMSSQQNEVVQSVLSIALGLLPATTTTLLPVTTTTPVIVGNSVIEQQQRYIFIPYEQAIERYPHIVSNIISTMKDGNGTRTGWVAIDTTTTNVQQSMVVVGQEENTTEMESNLESSSVGAVVGLVLYQLEWCALIESMETSAEMIVHILGMYVQEMSLPTGDAKDGTNSNIVPQVQGRRLFDSEIEQATFDNHSVASDTMTWVRLVLLSLVLEHARRYNVWYATITSSTAIDRLIYETYFRMVPTRCDEQTMICDLHNSTVRYTFLQYQETQQCHIQSSVERSFRARPCNSTQTTSSSGKERWLVLLPSGDEVRNCMQLSIVPESKGDDEISQCEPVPLQEHSSLSCHTKSGSVFSNPSMSKKGCRVLLSASFGENSLNGITLHRLNVGDSTMGSEVMIPSYYKEPPSLQIMRNFSLSPSTVVFPKQHDSINEPNNDPESYPIIEDLISKQQELKDLESDLEPTLYKLFSEVVSDRLAFESPARIAKQNEEIRIFRESEQLRERRLEQDLAWQKQLEQDMDAVCEICLDGEVTPDNQILFCELCNVAVHQMCYGIDRVPEGDYYCIPCRRLGLDGKVQDSGGQLAVPVSICCELCPLRQGAFVRTDIPPKETDTLDKFVHVLCAKWQGLNHIGDNKELVEDVTHIRRDFRRHHVKCELCQGERGGMNKCMASPVCKKWFHVTCARAVGTMNVIHGENCHGDVEEKAWKLFCPEHSDIDEEDIPENAVSIETLIRAAKEFPPEEIPPPLSSQFNVLTGPERRLLLADLSYEQALIKELLRSKYYGVRCEICDLFDDESKTWTRCISCNIIFCRFCKLDVDEVKGIYKCVSCKFVEQKKKAKEEYEHPKCCTCVQVGGLLRGSFAKPASGKYMKKPEYAGSLFAKQTWVHSLCAIWLPDLELPRDIGIVNLSGVVCVTNRGNSMINHKRRCFICGQKNGLKMLCDVEGCSCSINGTDEKMVMHVTCARQAGLEVRVDDVRVNDKGGPLAYVRCYRHCGNEFNLRAKLEDLLEIEKKRSGKEYAKADAPMRLSDASKLLYSAIQVMRIFGWAWRWAEWWVDYNSSWEPLLEPGQKEKNMTKEELKIIDSTRESRCIDARKCRLAAFGAAIRNRMYDTHDGFKKISFGKALRAILHTSSLAGPLTPIEIDFYIEWLGRAYRSKSRLLYLGHYKNSISNEASFCIHEVDGSPKYELGNRTLPGEQNLPTNEIFEADCNEIDSFLRYELSTDRKVLPIMLNAKAKRGLNPKTKSPKLNPSASTPQSKSKRGRLKSQPVDLDHFQSEDDTDTTYVPPTKRKRPVPDCVTTTQNQEHSKISPAIPRRGRGRPPRSSYTEQLQDSFFHDAEISTDEILNISSDFIDISGVDVERTSTEHPKVGDTDGLSDLLTHEVTTEVVCVDIPTVPELTITQSKHDDSDCGIVDLSEKVGHNSLRNTTVSTLEEVVVLVASIDRKPGSSPDESENISLAKEPSETTHNDDVKISAKSRSRLVPQRGAVDAPTYESVKKRRREPTRPFTYEHHEMKGTLAISSVDVKRTSTVHPKADNTDGVSDLVAHEFATELGCVDIPTNPESSVARSNHANSNDGKVDEPELTGPSGSSSNKASVSTLGEVIVAQIDRKPSSNESENISVKNEASEARRNDDVKIPAKSRSRSKLPQGAVDEPKANSSSYQTVKKRSREMTRPFTYKQQLVISSVDEERTSTSTEHPKADNADVLSDLLAHGFTTELGCVDIPTDPDSTVARSNHDNSDDGKVDESELTGPTGSSSNKASVSTLGEVIVARIDRTPSFSLNESENIYVKNEPSEATRNDDVKIPAKSRSRSKLLQGAVDEPKANSSSCQTVKKRTREKTLLFTYEHHEMKGTMRKRNKSMTETMLEAAIPSTSKKQRRRSNPKALTLETNLFENITAVAETNEPALSAPFVYDEIKDETPNMDPPVPIYTDSTTAEPVVTETEINATTATEYNSADVDVEFDRTDVVANTTLPVETRMIPSDSNTLTTADETSPSRQTRIRRPGRPRGSTTKNKRR